MISTFTSPSYVNRVQEYWQPGYGVTQLSSIAAPTLYFDFMTGVLNPAITFTRASSATYFDSAGVLQTALTNVPRFDYNPVTLAARGLLIEEARTNSIRNNTMQGAVAGTPGTNPTNWTITQSAAGLTREIVGTGTENGITYIDVRWSGTSTSAGTSQVNPETTTGVVALTGQTWTSSGYLKLAAGSFPGIASLIWQERDSGGTPVTTTSITLTTPTNAALNSQRYSNTRTLSGGASVAYVTARVDVTIPNATVVDFTLRIGLPQLEQGAFATSVIPTTTTALTRAADVASVNTLSPWFNAAEGTVYAEFVWEGLKSVAGQRIAVIDDGSTNNYWGALATSSNSMQGAVVVSGTTEAVNSTPATTYTANTLYKQTLALELNNSVSAINGTAGTPDTSVSVPSGLTTLRLAASSSTVTSNIWFRRITYYPRRLSDAELQAITS